MNSATPDVTVVVCTRDRADRLGAALGFLRAALDRAQDEGVRPELVVVDNRSVDGTPAVLAAARSADRRLVVVREDTPGLGRARNAGVAASSGAVLLFTDDDVAVPPDWLLALSRPVREGTADAVAGGVRMADDLWRDWMTEDLAAKYYAHVPVPPAVNPGLVGACMGAAREFASAVGFDDALGTAAYPGGEDSLFYVRLLAREARIVGVRDAVVEHRFDPSRLEASRLRRQAVGHGRSDAYFYHHWLGARFPAPRLRLAVHRGRVAAARARAPGDPYDERTITARRESSLHREMLALRGSPRRYGPDDGAPTS